MEVMSENEFKSQLKPKWIAAQVGNESSKVVIEMDERVDQTSCNGTANPGSWGLEIKGCSGPERWEGRDGEGGVYTRHWDSNFAAVAIFFYFASASPRPIWVGPIWIDRKMSLNWLNCPAYPNPHFWSGKLLLAIFVVHCCPHSWNWSFMNRTVSCNFQNYYPYTANKISNQL